MRFFEINFILILPEWKSAPFWPILLNSNGSYKYLIVENQILPKLSTITAGRYKKEIQCIYKNKLIIQHDRFQNMFLSLEVSKLAVMVIIILWLIQLSPLHSDEDHVIRNRSCKILSNSMSIVRTWSILVKCVIYTFILRCYNVAAGMWFCHFLVWYPGPGVVRNCIDSWSLPPFLLWYKFELELFFLKASLLSI